MQTVFRYDSSEGLWEMRYPGPKLYLNNQEVKYGGLYDNGDPHNLLFSKVKACYRWFRQSDRFCLWLAPGAILSVSRSGEVLLNGESPKIHTTIGHMDIRSGEDYSTSFGEFDALVKLFQQLPSDSPVWECPLLRTPEKKWAFSYEGHDIVFLESGAITLDGWPFYGDCLRLSEPKVGAIDLLHKAFIGLYLRFRFTPHGVFCNEDHFWSTIYIPSTFKVNGRFLAYEGWTDFSELRASTPSANWHWECYEFLFNLLVRKS